MPTENEDTDSSQFDGWLTHPIIGVSADSFVDSLKGEFFGSATTAQGSAEVAEADASNSGEDSGQQSGNENDRGDTPSDPERKEKATDDSRLIPAAPAFVSAAGQNTDDPQPKPGGDYDFCVDVINQSSLPSGSFTAHFRLGGDQDPPWEKASEEQDGLGPGATSTVCVHFGPFENKFADYQLDVSVIPKSAPDQRKDASLRTFTVMSDRPAGESGD